MQNKITAYFGHPIRGDTPNPTPEDLHRNNLKAIKAANQIRAWFPDLELYVPGEHDEFPQTAMRNNMLSVEDVLWIDKDILATKDCLLAYSWCESKGLKGEIDYAMRVRKRVWEFFNTIFGVLGREELESFFNEVRKELK